MACTFWTSQRPKVIKVLRTWCALQILMSKRGFKNALPGTTACNVWTCQSQLPKVLQRRCALPILTSKCASRHNSRHFFEYFKFQKCSATDTKFNVIYFQTRFAPQRRALFRHPATVFRTWGTFPFFDFQICFARHLPRRQNVGKNAVFRNFSTFQAPAPFLLLTWFSFFLSIPFSSDSSHLSCFSFPHCRTFAFPDYHKFQPIMARTASLNINHNCGILWANLASPRMAAEFGIESLACSMEIKDGGKSCNVWSGCNLESETKLPMEQVLTRIDQENGILGIIGNFWDVFSTWLTLVIFKSAL